MSLNKPKSEEADSEAVLLSILANEQIDDSVLAAWNEKIDAAPKPVKRVVFDFSNIEKISHQEITKLARHFGYVAKENNWQLVMLCSSQVEDNIENLGLSNLFRCYQVHGKAPPSEKLFTEEVDSAVLRQEIVIFFGHLIACFERISKALLGLNCSYCPPLDLLTDLSGQAADDGKFAIVRVHSSAMNYRLLFLISEEGQRKLSHIAFNGSDVSEAAIRDLILEMANNIMGNLSNQMAHEKISILFSIPESLASLTALPDADQSLMRGKALLRFRIGEVNMKLIVGYGLRC